MAKMSIETRYEVALEMAQSYRKATRKEKGRTLRKFCELTGYNPKYAVVILKKSFLEPEKLRNRTSGEAKKQKRKRRYGEIERATLAELWKLSGYLCGKLLVAFISENLEQLRRQGFLPEGRGNLRRLYHMQVNLGKIFNEEPGSVSVRSVNEA